MTFAKFNWPVKINIKLNRLSLKIKKPNANINIFIDLYLQNLILQWNKFHLLKYATILRLNHFYL